MSDQSRNFYWMMSILLHLRACSGQSTQRTVDRAAQLPHYICFPQTSEQHDGAEVSQEFPSQHSPLGQACKVACPALVPQAPVLCHPCLFQDTRACRRTDQALHGAGPPRKLASDEIQSFSKIKSFFHCIISHGPTPE